MEPGKVGVPRGSARARVPPLFRSNRERVSPSAGTEERAGGGVWVRGFLALQPLLPTLLQVLFVEEFLNLPRGMAENQLKEGIELLVSRHPLWGLIFFIV